MANYEQVARTNPFRVRDEAAFKADVLDRFCIEHWTKTVGGVVHHCLSADPNEGFWPNAPQDQDDAEDADVDFFDLVASHLAEDSIVVFMACGHEKLRYLSGSAFALNHKGEFARVALSDIYELARQKFGATPLSI